MNGLLYRLLRGTSALLALACLGPALSAQTPRAATRSAGTPAALPQQSLSFFVIVRAEQLPPDLPATLYVSDKPLSLRLPIGALSEPVLRPPAAGLVLHQALPAGAKRDPAAPTPPELARVDFPASWKNVLILLAASPASPQIRTLAYDVSENALPSGTLGFYNFTGRELAVQLNQERALTRPNTLTPLPLTTRPGQEGGMFHLRVAAQTDSAWSLVARHTLSLSKSNRNFALAVPSGDRIELLYFHPPADPVPDSDN